MSSHHGKRRPTIGDLIQQLQNVNHCNQQVEQEENCLQEEHLHLRAEEVRLIEQLAIAQAIDHQVDNEAVVPVVQPFAMGDRVVIDNPNPGCHRRVFDPTDWQGVVI